MLFRGWPTRCWRPISTGKTWLQRL